MIWSYFFLIFKLFSFLCMDEQFSHIILHRFCTLCGKIWKRIPVRMQCMVPKSTSAIMIITLRFDQTPKSGKINNVNNNWFGFLIKNNKLQWVVRCEGVCVIAVYKLIDKKKNNKSMSNVTQLLTTEIKSSDAF